MIGGTPLSRFRPRTVVIGGALVVLAVVVALGFMFMSNPEPDSDAAAPPEMRLLTEAQFRNTIAYVFGPSIAVKVRFPILQRRNGLLALSAANVGISTNDAEGFHRAAYAIAEQVVDAAHRDYLIDCKPADLHAADTACAQRTLGRVGRLLYRRSLSPSEIAALAATADKAAAQFHDFYDGLSFALAQEIASPEFLFAIEQSEPDPAHAGAQRLTGTALASRLSFLLWDAGPDDELIRAAEAGELARPSALAHQVDAMIASPRFEDGVRAFFDDMLGLADFVNLAKDPLVYPAFGAQAANDAKEQVLKTLVFQIVDGNADYRDLFTSRTTFLTPNLAPLYGIAAPAAGWARYDAPAGSHRAGLLTQIGFLAAHAHPGRSSPTRRGRALRELLMCQPVPDPPPNVDFSIVEDPKAHFKTARDRLTVHRTQPVCAGCHRLTDPMGLALENFDGAGIYRASENGAAIDASGALDGADFSDADGLGLAVRNNPATTACLVERAFSYGVGRELGHGDKTLMTYFNAQFRKNDYRVKDLLRTIATSRAFARVTPRPSTQTAQDSNRGQGS